jgi:ribosomal protein S21
MGIEVRKKSGESSSTLLFSFLKRVKRSGVLREARARRFHHRKTSRLKRRLSAIHKNKKRGELERARKLGLV